MNKPYWNIFISILVNFGCSQKITAEKNETFHAELNETFYDESYGTFYDELNETFYGESNGTSYDDSIETFYAELNKPSENLTAKGYEITHFNDKHFQVRNTLYLI